MMTVDYGNEDENLLGILSDLCMRIFEGPFLPHAERSSAPHESAWHGDVTLGHAALQHG
jgi:hypothetical protein